QRVQVTRGITSPLVMTSHGRGVVTGTVVDHGTHEPVAGLACHAVLRAGDLAGRTEWEPALGARTTDQGAFVLDPPPAGDIVVSCSGGASYSDGSVSATLGKGGRAAVQFEVVRQQFQSRAATTIDATADPNESAPILSVVMPGGLAARAGLV